MGSHYDAALVFGIDPTDGTFSPELRTALSTALLYWRQHIVNKIVPCGKYARKYNDTGTLPWFGTEAGWMKRYLVGLGCPPSAIITDEQSQDTVSNVVYAGEILQQLGARRVMIIGPAIRQKRILSLAERLFGTTIDITYVSIPDSPNPSTEQKELFTQIAWSYWLDNLSPGPASWPIIKSWLYDGPPYDFWKKFDAAHALLVEQGRRDIVPYDVMRAMNTTGLPRPLIALATSTPEI